MVADQCLVVIQGERSIAGPAVRVLLRLEVLHLDLSFLLPVGGWLLFHRVSIGSGPKEKHGPARRPARLSKSTFAAED